MGVIMWYRLSITATAGLLLGVAGAAAAELPTYEVMGIPITLHQRQTLVKDSDLHVLDALSQRNIIVLERNGRKDHNGKKTHRR
jgi:hypothetical protein